MNQIDVSEIGIVCPTKDQPEKIDRLLNSLSKQTATLSEIIISDSGRCLEHIILPYSEKLNITYLKCPYKGQVLQRNYGYKYLSKKIKLIINLDDDNVLERDAIEKFLLAWNTEVLKKGPKLVGMSFNIKNAPLQKKSVFRKIFFMQGIELQNVSKAGYAFSYLPAKSTNETSWLVGGSTGWLREVIGEYSHPIDFPTKWAVCEDLIFSYPLSKHYRLAVAVDARVEHNETYEAMTLKKSIFYGLSQVIMRYHFVCRNKDLSKLAFIWMNIGQLIAYLTRSILGSKRYLGFFIGGLIGLTSCFGAMVTNRCSKQMAINLFKKS